MNKHKDSVRTVKFVENFQDEMLTEKTFTKKAQQSFLVSRRRYQDFRHTFTKSKSS